MSLEAIFDVWFIGDTFVKKSFQGFKDMQLKAKSKNRAAEEAGEENVVLPYLYEFYNVFSYTQLGSSGIKSMLARIKNALKEGLNARDRLPRFLVIMLDKDVMDEIDIFEPEKAMLKNFHVVIQWLCRQVNILIKRKRLAISAKNPGAVFGDDPRVILVKMIRRAEFYSSNCRLGKMCAVRPKFNECLNTVAAKFDFYIMNVTTCNGRHHFDICGNLSESGKKCFWAEVDHLMERFDRNDIQLLPSGSRNGANKHA